MFRFLTPTAKEVISGAQSFGAQRGVLVEADLIAGLLGFPEAVASQALSQHLKDVSRLQVPEPTELDAVTPNDLIEMGVDDGHLPGATVAWDRTCVDALRSARDEAILLRHRYMGTEHLLLGLLRAGRQLPEALTERGVDLEALRRTVRWAVAPGEVEIQEQVEVFFELRRTDRLNDELAQAILDILNREYQEAIALSLRVSGELSKALPDQVELPAHPWRP